MFHRLRQRITPPDVEQREVLLAGKLVSYTLKRSPKRCSIGLRIDDRGLTVSMPLRASERWLQSVLQDKAAWVMDKLNFWQQRVVPSSQSYVDGAFVPFLGENLRLRIQPGLFEMPPQRQAQSLWIFVCGIANPQAVEQRVQCWYREQAESLLAARVAHYADHMQLAPRSVRLSAAKTQWGSCSMRGIIRLNQGLVRLPLALIDYVVVHELAHLREMNHSAAFWQVVATARPDYLRLRRELRAFVPG